jgi:hypothetical protein
MSLRAILSFLGELVILSVHTKRNLTENVTKDMAIRQETALLEFFIKNSVDK